MAKTKLINENSKVKNTFFDNSNIDLFKDSGLNSLFYKNDNYGENEIDDFSKKETQALRMNIDNTSQSEKKPLKIFMSDVNIPQ